MPISHLKAVDRDDRVPLLGPHRSQLPSSPIRGRPWFNSEKSLSAWQQDSFPSRNRKRRYFLVNLLLNLSIILTSILVVTVLYILAHYAARTLRKGRGLRLKQGGFVAMGGEESEEGEEEEKDMVAQAMGWISAAFMFGSRLSQILKNRQTKCEGLSLGMFIFSFMGNLMTMVALIIPSSGTSPMDDTLSALFHLTPSNSTTTPSPDLPTPGAGPETPLSDLFAVYLSQLFLYLSLLLSSGLTMTLDTLIVIQVLWYRKDRLLKEMQEEIEKRKREVLDRIDEVNEEVRDAVERVEEIAEEVEEVVHEVEDFVDAEHDKRGDGGGGAAAARKESRRLHDIESGRSVSSAS